MRSRGKVELNVTNGKQKDFEMHNVADIRETLFLTRGETAWSSHPGINGGLNPRDHKKCVFI